MKNFKEQGKAALKTAGKVIETAPQMMNMVTTPYGYIVGGQSRLDEDASYLLNHIYPKLSNVAIHDNAKWTYFPLCCCFDKVSRRLYFAIHERAILSNYPKLLFCGLCKCDCARIHHVSQWGHFSKRSCCTPFHLCCCIECCGQVVTEAPYAWCNYPCCICCQMFYPGLQDAEGTVRQIEALKQQHLQLTGQTTTNYR